MHTLSGLTTAIIIWQEEEKMAYNIQNYLENEILQIRRTLYKLLYMVTEQVGQSGNFSVTNQNIIKNYFLEICRNK